MSFIQNIFAYEYLGRQHLAGFDKYKVFSILKEKFILKHYLILLYFMFFSRYSIAVLTIRRFRSILCIHFGMRSWISIQSGLHQMFSHLSASCVWLSISYYFRFTIIAFTVIVSTATIVWVKTQPTWPHVNSIFKSIWVNSKMCPQMFAHVYRDGCGLCLLFVNFSRII